MNDYIVESVLRGVLGGKKRKKSKKALKYLTHGYGGRGGSIFSNPNVALTAAGLAWGIFETLQQPAPAAGPVGGAGLRTGSTATPASTAATAAALPPLPNLGTATDDTTRLIRLAVSAANADGSMNEQERAAIVQHAGPEGEVVAGEMAQRRALADIVAGVTDPAQRATLYVLAYSIIRADEQVSGAERIYLAQLAHLLRLDPPTVQKLEADTAERIDRS